MALNLKIVSDIAEKLGMPEVLTQFQSEEAPADGVNPFADALTPLQVFQESQLTERLTNERAAAAEEARKTAVGNTYGAMDKRILAETGVAKNDNESTVDYMARAAKEKFGTKVDESAEMTRLRADLTAKDGLLAQTNTKLQEIEVAHATERKQTQVNGTIDAPINALAIDVKPELLDSQRRFLKHQLLEKYEADLVDGQVQFTDKVTKQVKRDPKTAAPMTAEALVAEFAPSVVSVKVPSQRSGAGVKAADNSKNSGPDNLADFATLDDYKKHLTESGITLLSQAGQDKISAYLAAQNK